MKRVYISVGHGGSDPGAIGRGVTGGIMRESKINLNVALRLAQKLREAGVDVMLSREDDQTFVNISTMKRQARAFKADCVIGVHHNAGGGKGWEVLHQQNKESERLADLIGTQLNALNEAHGKNPTYVSSRSLGLMTCEIVTVITEPFFLDTEDVRDIDELSEQWAEANAIAYAVLQWLGLR